MYCSTPDCLISRWRRISLSIKGNSATLLDECKEIGSRALDRTDADLDTDGVVFIGREMESLAYFEVTICVITV